MVVTRTENDKGTASMTRPAMRELEPIVGRVEDEERVLQTHLSAQIHEML